MTVRHVHRKAVFVGLEVFLSLSGVWTKFHLKFKFSLGKHPSGITPDHVNDPLKV